MAMYGVEQSYRKGFLFLFLESNQSETHVMNSVLDNESS